MTAAELVERVARKLAFEHATVNPGASDPWEALEEESAEYWCKRDFRILARAAIAETLAAILEEPARGIKAGYSLIDALAAEIREGK